MVNELDGMKVLAISQKSLYAQIGKIKDTTSEISSLEVTNFKWEWEDVHYFAICECSLTGKIFFCRCTEDMKNSTVMFVTCNVDANINHKINSMYRF